MFQCVHWAHCAWVCVWVCVSVCMIQVTEYQQWKEMSSTWTVHHLGCPCLSFLTPSIHFLSLPLFSLSTSLARFAVFLHRVHSDSVEIFGPYPTHPFIPSAHLTFYFLHRFLSVSISQLLCPWKFELCSKFSSLFILTCFYSFTPPRFYFVEKWILTLGIKNILLLVSLASSLYDISARSQRVILNCLPKWSILMNIISNRLHFKNNN